MDALVELNHVHATRGSFELSVPRLVIEPGTIVGVVGPNGAGKTTLLRLLPGLDAPDRGSVRVLGLDPIVDPAAVRARVGFMSDDMEVFDVKIGKLLRLISGYYPSWSPTLVDTLVQRFQIDVAKRPSQLSKGEGTRLRLIMAMAFRPRLLVLDEPATGLDVGGRLRLLESVLEVVQDDGCSVVISSHQLGDVQRIADELVVLDDGQVLGTGPTDRLIGEHGSLEEALVRWGAAG